MPSVSIYIKEADWDKWKSIEKKSEFLADALNSELRTYPVKLGNAPDIPMKNAVIKSFKSNQKLGEVINIPKISSLRPDNGACKKHGNPLTANGKCLQKGH